ncbi:hypothetical protein M878_01500 [Streptomyces roseochromogenus subsp. oscitans DS 12.976]|uniref:Uncharacterized protein n=1 Tax=Streptomyces roseochromogenus subsp. oscitans DS 12.976 TaxID=1352936 RepID=V6L5T2_STRRC|nr:hypothetical protein M878_01500 [Streptomyces roseochromogenus subsp. oscitans DS 12.976]
MPPLSNDLQVSQGRELLDEFIVAAARSRTDTL